MNGNFYFIESDSKMRSILIGIGLFLLIFKVFFLVFLFIAYKKYRPIVSVTNQLLPKLTVIVPAYNEGEQVYKTLINIANSDYPKEKINIISIDDGSVDTTWKWMQKAKTELKNTITILQQSENKGKRDALYRAFKLTQSEVIVTIDSDSMVDKNTLRNLVSPFITNSNCGGVAGNVKVLNNKNAIIPKMLDVSFAFSFEFIRSAQSYFGSVLCTPGALSAYRKEVVDHCMEEWVNQTFLGKRTQIGEDRAMTNMILKQGYHVKFQSNAKVFTEIPENYTNLRKMFTRWERSNVRENIMMGKFAFTYFRKERKWPSRIILINQWIKVIMAYPALILMLAFLFYKPLLFISTTMFSILIFASIPAFFYYKKTDEVTKSLLSYNYSIFYAVCLFWITPYAIITAGKNKWLTRSKMIEVPNIEQEVYI